MSRIVEADYCQQWVFPPCLEDLLPTDHPARFIRDLVDQFDLRELGFRLPNAHSAGGPAYSPELLLRVWLYGWLRRIRTPRKLEAACRNDIAVMWLAGMHMLDHTTLWRFWETNRPAMKPLFAKVVKVALNMGLVSMAFHAIDGTKIAPASSSRSALHKDDLERLLLELEDSIAQMESEIAHERDQQPGDSSLPAELADAQRRVAAIRKNLALLEEADKSHMLPAEPQVQMIAGGGGKTAFNYNAQAVADDAHGIIVAQDVCTDALDTAMLLPMLRHAEANLGQRAQHTAADGGYTNQMNIDQATREGWNVTLPIGNRQELHNALHSHHFAHNAQSDCLTCPATGQQLPFARHSKAKGRAPGKIYRCPVTATCPLKTACTSNQRGREIEVTIARPSVLLQVEKHMDGRMGQHMRRRLGLIERIFGWIKEQLGVRRVSIKGIEKARDQWTLICTTYNLSKILPHWQRQQALCANADL